jgi:uncharacterized protein involved in exopolysaccharide biosynthesis
MNTDALDEPQNANLGDMLEVVRRRRRPLLWTLAAVLLTTLALALLLPPVYRSTATILIEQQEVPQDLVRSTITSYADERVQVMSQRVMTTQNLLEIIRRYGLYPRELRRESREKLIEQMRDDIQFRLVSADVIDPRSGIPRKATIAFTVSYDNKEPDLAVKVANELTTLYLNENLTSRTQSAQDTAGFLNSESERLSKRVSELEAALADFKRQNLQNLPELAQLNMQLMDRTDQQIRDNDAELRSLSQQRVFLQAQLVQIKPNSVLISETGERILSSADRLKMLKSSLASRRALYAPNHPDIVRLEREIAGLEDQKDGAADVNDLRRDLEQARGELGAARERYAPEHPDVRRLERQVASLEAALAAKPSAPATTAAPVTADNPAYVQLEAQLTAVINNQRSLQQKSAQLQALRENYQRKMATSPAIEQRYRELSRDYEGAQLKYNEVRSKQMEATLAQNLETNRKGERFTLIEPPLPPEQPVSPNRLAILIIGFVLALGSAGAAAAIAESLDTSIRGRKDLAQLWQESPLALIPMLVSEGDRLKSRQRVKFAAGASLAGVLATLALVHFLVRPLDVVWFVLTRRYGL